MYQYKIFKISGCSKVDSGDSTFLFSQGSLCSEILSIPPAWLLTTQPFIMPITVIHLHKAYKYPTTIP